ncbi:MAG: Na+/H+ antiporter subunit E [Myxococcales bacterium]|jgi:multisubunit Na+/H+ antiporter MnhE subunit|nr:Na+/H+ antiporter subunit E [Myxococcales bacterium]
MSAVRLLFDVVSLLAIFVLEIVFSGVKTAGMILSPYRRPKGAIVRMRYEGLSETGAVVLASMVAVTPGSTPVEIDHERGEMWIHFLDAEHAAGSIASIEARFASRLRRIFPGRTP